MTCFGLIAFLNKKLNEVDQLNFYFFRNSESVLLLPGLIMSFRIVTLKGSLYQNFQIFMQPF